MAESPMAKKCWDELITNEKLDCLTSGLTLAGVVIKFRGRGHVSPDSVKKAIGEVGGIEFPPDFRVQFLTPEERLKTLILTVPDYTPTDNGSPEVRNAEDYQP